MKPVELGLLIKRPDHRHPLVTAFAKTLQEYAPEAWEREIGRAHV